MRAFVFLLRTKLCLEASTGRPIDSVYEVLINAATLSAFNCAIFPLGQIHLVCCVLSTNSVINQNSVVYFYLLTNLTPNL